MRIRSIHPTPLLRNQIYLVYSALAIRGRLCSLLLNPKERGTFYFSGHNTSGTNRTPPPGPKHRSILRLGNSSQILQLAQAAVNRHQKSNTNIKVHQG